MEYNKLRYLQQVKHVQDLTRSKQEQYPFITYAEIHRQLCAEKQFFFGYHTYLKYINEPQINTRIEKLKATN